MDGSGIAKPSLMHVSITHAVLSELPACTVFCSGSFQYFQDQDCRPVHAQNSNTIPADGRIGNMLKKFGYVRPLVISYGPGESKSLLW